MRFLRQNTAVIITVGPFYDKTDGVTIETALTITNERITLTADTDDNSAPTNILDNVTGATSATDNDLNYITGNDAGMMQLELSAANTNRVGRMFLSITDAANHVPVFHEFMVMPALVYDTFFAASGGATFPAATLASTTNITAGTITTATNVTTVNGLAANVITAASIATGAIDADAIAADAIGASELAADAATEIANAVWDTDATARQTQGTFGQAIGDPGADTNTIFKATVTDATGVTVGTDSSTLLTRLGTPSDLGGGATLSANLSDIEGQTDDIGVAGAGLTAIPWNAAWDAEVQSEVDDALVAQRLDELLNADSDIDGLTPPTVGSVFHELLTKSAAAFTYDQTTDSLEAIRDKETDIETHTAEIGAAGAGLTNINLPDQTMNITGDITGNLSGSVGSVTGAVGSVTGAVGSIGAGGIAAASFAAGAIDAAAIATGAIDADAIADNAIDAGAIAANAITAAKIADGAIDAATFAAGAIDAAAIADSALDALTFTAVICTGTIGVGSTTTSIVCSAISPASAVNDQFVGRIMIFDRATTTAALRGQATDITDWVHATTTATVTALTTAPASGDSFHIL